MLEGVRVIRMDKHAMAIKVQTYTQLTEAKSHGWKFLEKGFKTLAELQKRFDEILSEKNTIAG